MAELTTLDWIARILVIIGALNWGLVAVLDFNVVDSVFGALAGWLATVVYILVALSGLWELIALFK